MDPIQAAFSRFDSVIARQSGGLTVTTQFSHDVAPYYLLCATRSYEPRDPLDIVLTDCARDLIFRVPDLPAGVKQAGTLYLTEHIVRALSQIAPLFFAPNPEERAGILTVCLTGVSPKVVASYEWEV